MDWNRLIFLSVQLPEEWRRQRSRHATTVISQAREVTAATAGRLHRSLLCFLWGLIGSFPGIAHCNPVCPGTIEVEVVEAPMQGKPERFFLTYQPSLPDNDKPVEVRFPVSGLYSVTNSANLELSTAILQPNKRQEFSLSLRQDNPGLIRLNATVSEWDRGCPQVNYPIDTGFRDTLLLESRTKGFVVEDETHSAPPRIEPGVYDIVLDFVDRNHRRQVILGTAVTLTISVVGDSQIFDKKWTQTTEITSDGSSVAVLRIRPVEWGTEGLIRVDIKKQAGPANIANYEIRYVTNYPWYLLFLSTLAGSLLYVFIESIPSLNKPTDGSPAPPYKLILLKDGGSKLYVAVTVAIVAYLLRDTSVLEAVKFDATTLRGYVILGFLTNVFGLEAIFKKIRSLIQ
jgi:hypothetical protein